MMKTLKSIGPKKSGQFHLSIWLSLLIVFAVSCTKKSSIKDYPIQPVSFTHVKVNDQFWAPRIETNRTVTIPYDFKKCEETGRISNFAKAGGLEEGEFEGIYYNDSDVYKVIEGASYSLSVHPDPELDKYLDGVIAKIAAAQEDDGYLYTNRTINPEKATDGAGEKRWTRLDHYHELYCVGHLYEAAVAHYQATGKKSLLNVALKNADLICNTFGPGKNMGVPGHEEIEIGLVKLYRVTGKEKYLKMAKFFLDQRGNAGGHKLYGPYTQDHKPIIKQDEAIGHAVRAGYLYSGIADVAALTGDQAYVQAIDKIWQNVVGKKIYITGGIGARREGEAFGDNYELPNLTAYNETCAAIANMFWNHRLFLLHGEAKYMDVFERTLYNGFLAGISLQGNEFFYPNPLESDGKLMFNQGAATRKPWFDCSCCPVNIVRFLPSLSGYIYARKKNKLFVNLFIGGEANLKINGKQVQLVQETKYPWDGRVKIFVNPVKQADFSMNIRIPGWTMNRPIPSDLYRYVFPQQDSVSLHVNGAETALNLENGFAKIDRTWQKGDVIELNLPMKIRKVVSNEKVAEDRGKIALERGPVVFCAEGVDNHGRALNLLLSKDVQLKSEFHPDLLHGVMVLEGKAKALIGNGKKVARFKKQNFMAIPYYAWSHRGVGEMTVWLPYEKSVLLARSRK